MLVLARKANERIVIILPNGDKIFVTAIRLEQNVVRLGFDAPDEVRILREEIMRD